MRIQTPPEKGGGAPSPISAHFYCGQSAGCIKVPLDMKVGLSQGKFVLDGDPPPPKKGAAPPIFGPCLLLPNGCMDQDATWYGGRHRPRQHCVRRGPSSASPKRGQSPTPFSAHVYCGQTADGSRWYLAWTRALVQATLC